MYSKSVTSILNISLTPSRSSIFSFLTILLEYPLSFLLYIQSLVFPRRGSATFAGRWDATFNFKMNGLWNVFDETAQMKNSAYFIKNSKIDQTFIKQLIPLFHEKIWCICVSHKSLSPPENISLLHWDWSRVVWSLDFEL